MKASFFLTVSLLTLVAAGMPSLSQAQSEATPNFIVIFADDLGYGDWKFLMVSAKEKTSEATEVELSEAEKKLPRSQRKALIKERQRGAQKGKGAVEMLFNLREDIGEHQNRMKQNPDIADRLRKRLATFSAEFKRTSRSAGVAERFSPSHAHH